MPDLNPLKFQVAIQDEATGQLKKIEQEFEKLKDKTISVKVEGLSDLQQLLSALQHQQVSNLGKDVGSAINDASRNLQKEAQEAVRVSLGNLAQDLASIKEAIQSDNFSAFSKRIETCAEKITLLDEAFKRFKVTIGENKELKDLLTGWGAAVKEVSAAMAAMNSVKNGGGAKAAQKEELKQQEEGLIKVANAMGRVREAASGIGGASVNGVAFMESINKVGERNIQTLIKEQGHIERLIAIAKKSIDFGEGHPVLGMGRLRGDQMQNLQNLEQLKKIINEILYAANQGDQAAIRFLNTLGSLKTTPFGKDSMGNDITLLGGHFDKLTHSVTGTANAMRQLNANMRLDNIEQYKQWNTENLTKGLRNVDEAIKNIKTSWQDIQNTSAGKALENSVEHQLRLLSELRQKITSAMSNEDLLRTRHGYGSVIDTDYSMQIDHARQLRRELDSVRNQFNSEIQHRKQNATTTAENLGKHIDKLNAQKIDFRGLDTTAFDSAIAKIRAIQDELKSFVRTGLSRYGTTANEIVRSMNLADANKAAVNAQKELRKEISDTATAERRFKSEQEAGYNAVATKIADVQIKIDKYKQALAGAVNTPVSTSALDAQKQKVEELARLLEQIRNNKGVTDDGRTMKSVMREYGQYIKQADYAMSNLNKQVAEHNRNAKKDPAVEAQKEYASLVKQIARMQKTEIKASNIGVDTTELRRKIELLERYRQDLERLVAFKGNNNGFTIFDFRDTAYHNARANGSVERQRTEAIYQTEKANRAAAQAANQLTAEEQRLAQALNQTTESARGQSQVLSDLKSMAAQYLGVWGAQSYLHKIIETGGQLEQQRLSLSAILGDVEKANTLFGQVKELAIKSPFGVVQIDQMTKQLAAYSFEYEELFDWTKRLADISAATGTEVSRLALALGHVRSEGALSGYTLRQFAMANVPVLRMLSENLGISTKEVRERVKKKEISADDVQEILKQLTDEGGMFYNAQETMSEALNAKYKNLRDAFDIMYGEIAEGGVGEALKEIAIILTQGAKEWERFGKDILMVAAAFGIGKAAIALYNTALGEGTAATLRSIAAAQQRENANLRLARASGLVTKAEYEQLISNERYSVSALKVALTTNKLTIEELQRAVALGKVNKTVAQAAVVAAGYDAALISNVRVLGMWRRGIFLLSEGFRAAKVAVKGFLASVWPLLALTAVFDLVNRASSQNDAAKEASEGAAKATNKYQDLQAMTERLGNSQGKTNDQLESNIKAMKEALVAVGEYTDELKEQVDSVDSLAEKYNILHEAMKNVSEQASDRQSRKQAIIEEGLSSGGGTAWNPLNWFRDNALQDAKDIDDYTKDLYLALDENDKVLREGFRKILKTRGEWQEKFATMSAKDIFMSLSPKQQNDVLYKGRWGADMSRDMNKASEAVARIMYGSRTATSENVFGYSYVGAFNELIGHKEELAKAFEDAFRVDYPEIDLSKADEDQKIIFAKWLDTTIANLADVKEAGKKALNDIIIEGTIKVRPQYSYDSDNWEDFLKDFEEKNPLAFYEWNKHANAGPLSIEEKRKSAESYKRTFGGSTAATIGNDSKKQLKELGEEEIRLINERSSAIYRESEEERQRVENRLAEIKIQRERLKKAQKDTNQYGDLDKSMGKSEDKDARRLREIVKLYKDAYDWYGKYEKQVGEGSALAKVKEQFQPLFDEFRNQWKQSLSLDSIPEYKQNLETLLSEAQKLYESPKHKNSYMVEAIKTIRDAINNVDYEEAQRKMDEYASKVQIELDGLTRAWDIFNDVREATGNVDLAVQLSGADYQAGQTRNLADALRAKIEKDFAFANAVAIPFDINMSDKDIENNIKGAIPKESEERIKGIVEEYKKWRDLQRDVIKNDILNYSKLIGSVVTYDAEIKKINTKLEQQKQSNNALVGIKKKDGNIFTQADADKANDIAETNANFDKLKLSSSYINLMNNSLSMTKAEVTNAAKAVEKSLNERLRLGVINAKEYADEMKKLHEITQQFNENAFFGKNNPFTAFMRGGLKGSLNFTSGRIQELQTKREDDALTKKEQQELDELLKLQVKLEKAVAGLNSFATSLQIVTGVLDGFKKGAQSLSEMFDALGKKGAANTWSDISDGIDAASSIFAPANNIVSNAMNGNIGGVISSAISAPIEMFAAPITGFAKLHDKKLERQIEQLEEAKTQRENMISVLHTLRDRTLGYDNGDLLRAIAARYQGDNSTGGRNMYEYYSRGGLNGSGYQQELEALKKQREDTLAQLEAEEDKKKSSDEAIESYKKQIAEIDDQVIHFGEDLANSLWGIDIKGWADQITDALMTAFENGESAVKAYNETVKSIMQSVVSEMLKIGIIEPMMKRLRNKLFGENGVTTADKLASDPVAESKKVLAAIGEYFKPGGEGSNMTIAAQEYMEGVNNLMKQMGYANGLRNNESANTLSSGIQGTSEETSDLLAGYVNALRQDVAINRLLLNQFVSELWPSYIEQVTILVRGVGNIDANVSAIRTLLSENGAIYMMLDSMRNHFDSITNGNESVALK